MYKSSFIPSIILIFLFTFTMASQAQYSGGSGTYKDPYQIANVSDWQTLVKTSADWNKKFIMTADLDLKGIPITPIGNISKQFTGVFNGNGHIICNADVNMPDDVCIGLFGIVEDDAQICNLGIENITVNGRDHVGGLVGWNEGSITACYINGSVNGDRFVGGLVGAGAGALGSITNSYAIVGVKGFDDVGALVGSASCRITACYATGLVSGFNVHGLIGWGVVSKISACFWDVETTGQTDSYGGTGKTTAEMKTRSTYTDAGWDFVGETDNGTEDTWSICEGTNYPRLTWQIPTADWLCPDGVGMEDFSYLAQFWMILEDDIPVDLDKNNAVGISDLIIFSEQWLMGR